ncbi:hypothetical protein GEV33_002602 [Tenebrio molitor]|uniref:Uncharacterized protein n=1 Tax=Tenebrio molitor TaxID=7067 RepID=A0A8J6HT50_TENMO|nr:hypothetical protein GEV33_002602 [Tenebrio molitor]
MSVAFSRPGTAQACTGGGQRGASCAIPATPPGYAAPPTLITEGPAGPPSPMKSAGRGIFPDTHTLPPPPPPMTTRFPDYDAAHETTLTQSRIK